MDQLVAESTRALALSAKPAPPCTLVIFGANGDLTKRLLMPSLYNLAGTKLLDARFSVIGVDRDPGSDADFQGRQTASMRSFTPDKGGEFAEASLDGSAWGWLSQRLHYMVGDFTQNQVFDDLARRLGDENVIFYLAVPDRFFGGIIERLHEAGLTEKRNGRFRRVVIEKPFGHDIASARALNKQILSLLDEDQIYRIDHFLGKETVQNIMALRFSNGIFEPLWTRDHIDYVEITAAETVGVEKRGKFYEVTGALRDMVPNHMFQLLAMVTMEPPNSFAADAVRAEKAKAIDALHMMSAREVMQNVVRGQYAAGQVLGENVAGYRNEPDVAPDSNVETYVALRLFLDNWRWAGVPFYLRTGKRLMKRKTEVAIHFKPAPIRMFRDVGMERLGANAMILHVQPEEGISIYFSAKHPGQVMDIDPVRMDFKYADFFDLKPSTGYETLLYDVLTGDQTLFNRADNIENGWCAVDPILREWASHPGIVHPYFAGGQGPNEADSLPERHGHSWRKL